MQRGKVENATAEMLRCLDQLIERKEGGGVDKTYYDLRDMYGGHVWRRILLPIYAYCESLLLTLLCCDDIHDVTPRVSALAGYDKYKVGKSSEQLADWIVFDRLMNNPVTPEQIDEFNNKVEEMWKLLPLVEKELMTPSTPEVPHILFTQLQKVYDEIMLFIYKFDNANDNFEAINNA
ncbi:hypothetical protein Tco_0356763 [Tanacetum coccineum]